MMEIYKRVKIKLKLLMKGPTKSTALPILTGLTTPIFFIEQFLGHRIEFHIPFNFNLSILSLGYDVGIGLGPNYMG